MGKHDFALEDVSQRKTEGRQQRKPEELRIEELSDIQARFDDAMADVQGLSGIYEHLAGNSNMTDSDKDGLQDLLRSQILLMESALDLYMHEVSKYGISKIFNSNPHWTETTSFRDFKVTLGDLKDVYYGKKTARNMSSLISGILQHSSYMKFDAVIKQLVMIGTVKDENSVPSDIAAFRPIITDLNDRRNLIAHASDRDFKKDFRGQRQKIEQAEVLHFYEELRKFEKVIHTYISNK